MHNRPTTHSITTTMAITMATTTGGEALQSYTLLWVHSCRAAWRIPSAAVSAGGLGSWVWSLQEEKGQHGVAAARGKEVGFFIVGLQTRYPGPWLHPTKVQRHAYSLKHCSKFTHCLHCCAVTYDHFLGCLLCSHSRPLLTPPRWTFATATALHTHAFCPHH
jgi:hypothetical protein